MAEIAFTTAGRNAAWDSSGTGLDFSVAYFRLFHDGNNNPPDIDADTVQGDLGNQVYPDHPNDYADITSTVQISDSQREFRIHLDSNIGSDDFDNDGTFRSVALYLNTTYPIGHANVGDYILFAVIVLDDDFTKSTDNEFRLNIPMQFSGDLDPLEIVNVTDAAPARIVEVADLESLGKAANAGSRTTASASYAYEFTLPSTLPDDGAVVATLSPRPVSNIVVKEGTTVINTSSSGSDKGLKIVGSQIQIATSGTRYLPGTAFAGGDSIRIEYNSTSVGTHNTYLVQDLNILAHVSVDTDGDMWEFEGYHHIGDVDINTVDSTDPAEWIEVDEADLSKFAPVNFGNYVSGDLIIQTKEDSSGSDLVVGLAKRISSVRVDVDDTIMQTIPLFVAKLFFARPGGPAHNMADGDTVAIYARNKFSKKISHPIEIDDLKLSDRYITPADLEHSRLHVRAWATFSGTKTFILDDYNVSSFTDINTGEYRITWETPFLNEFYSCMLSAGLNSGSSSDGFGGEVSGGGNTIILNTNLNNSNNTLNFRNAIRIISRRTISTDTTDTDVILGSALVVGSAQSGLLRAGLIVDPLQSIVNAGELTTLRVRLRDADANLFIDTPLGVLHESIENGNDILATTSSTNDANLAASGNMVLVGAGPSVNSTGNTITFTSGNYATWQYIRLRANTDLDFGNSTAIQTGARIQNVENTAFRGTEVIIRYSPIVIDPVELPDIAEDSGSTTLDVKLNKIYGTTPSSSHETVLTVISDNTDVVVVTGGSAISGNTDGRQFTFDETTYDDFQTFTLTAQANSISSNTIVDIILTTTSNEPSVIPNTTRVVKITVITTYQG